ncbi:restriction endonuclease subunit S [Runella zeae]|uniref:restriction endonuclease subunit S n=1 Tax=Runella zeae TaxID=94255 RepID=UPI000400144F|nr:restriction endonuclease subunit S [Runella zeae]
MSRGRKKAKSSGLDWEGLFHKSQGVYFQFILSELGKKADFTITNDTGAALLEKIKAEKAQLIKEKKLKVEKGFPPIKPNEIPFEIPKNWIWVRLGDICNFGSSPKAEPKYIEATTWVLDLEDIEKDTSKLLNKIRFAERNSLSSKSIFKSGQILYSKLRPYLDKVIIADEDGVCTTEILPIEFYGESNPFFNLLALKRKDFLEYVNSVTKGMKMPRLGTKEGQMSLFPLAPLSEQNKIAQFLQDFSNQSLIEGKEYFDSETEKKVIELHESQLAGNQLSTELTHQLDLVKQLRQAFLREAMQGKLTPSLSQESGQVETGQQLLAKIKAEKAQLIAAKKLKKEKDLPPIKPEEIPFDIPEYWTWCRLGEIAYIASGSTPKPEAFVTNGIPYLKMYNLRGQKIDFDYKPQYIKEEIHNGQLKRSRTQIGDVIMNIVGPPLGKLALIPDSLPECNFNQAAVLIRPYKYQNLNKWVFWYLNEMSEINSIVTKGVAGQDNISITQSNNMKLPLPPLSEQQRIVEKLESLMQTCDALEASIKDGQRQNEQLLQQVLREALKK